MTKLTTKLKLKHFNFILFFAFIGSLNAQSFGIDSWSRAAKIFHGTTNEIKAIKADNKGNSYYAGYGYEINPGSRHGFIAGKLNDTLKYVWKNHFFGFPSRGETQNIVLDDSNMFVLGEFIDQLIFGTDTLRVKNIVNSESFLVCLSTRNGDLKWAKNLGRVLNANIEHDGNKDLVLSYSIGNGIQIFDGQNIDTVTVQATTFGYGYLTLNKADGSLKNFCYGSNNILNIPKLNTIVGRKVHSLIVPTGGPYNPTILRHRILDLNTNTVTYLPQNVPFSGTLTYLSYLEATKQWIASIPLANSGIIMGLDTIKRPAFNLGNFTIVRFDSNFKVLNYVSCKNAFGTSRFLVKDTNILFSWAENGDGHFYYKDKIDTIKVNTHLTQSGYFIANCNLSLENFSFKRVNSLAGTGSVMMLKTLDIDSSANVYIGAFDQNDIYALPYKVVAARKSWRNLSIVAKHGVNGIQEPVLSVNELKTDNETIVFPNPASDIVTIQSKSFIKNVKLFDLQGKVLLINNSNTLNIADLKTGIYFISIETNDGTTTKKLIKQ